MVNRSRSLVRAGAALAVVLAGALGSALSRPGRPADPRAAPAAPGAGHREIGSAFALPLAFEENAGRLDPRARFVGRSAGGTVFLTDSGAVLSTEGPGGRSASVGIALAGSRTEARPVGERELPWKVSSFVGDDPSRWRSGIRALARVRYPGVYPGIDVVYRHGGRDLEFDLEVAPGADPSIIRVEFPGADAVRLDGSGDVVLSFSGREVRQRRPRAYQGDGAGRREIGAGYVLAGDAVAFRLDAYDRRRPLVIDPVITYSTYLGGSGNDDIGGIAVDAGGNAYVLGTTYSSAFPQGGSAPTRPMFVAKLDPTGQSFVYLTYVGSTGGDRPTAIALDAEGNAYITGYTDQGFPTTTGAYQTARRGGNDAFVAKLNPAGDALVYSTYLGGVAEDHARGIAVDATGNAYVTGSTVFSSFPQVNPLPFNGNFVNAFVTKLAPDGRSLVFSTLLGGNDNEEGTAIALDAQANVHVVGYTRSANFPASNALSSSLQGSQDAFVSKLRADGQALLYSTFLGGSGAVDKAGGVAVDSAGRAVIVGETDSADFPTRDALQGALASSARDFFVTKLDATGGLVFSTFLGDTGADTGTFVRLDRWDNIHVAGYTYGSLTPKNGFRGQNTGPGGTTDAMVASLGSSGKPLIFATLLGGGQNDDVKGIAVGPDGDLFVAGTTGSSDFVPQPTVAAMQGTAGGGTDGFVTHIWLAPCIAGVAPTFGPTAGGTAVTLAGLGFQAGASVTIGGTAAADVVVVDASTITATTPPHAVGFAPVVVTNPDTRWHSLPVGFSYTDAPAPAPSGVSPSSGPAAGGTMVTVSGSAFRDFASVTFGGVASTSVAFVDSSTLTAVAPAHAPGLVAVSVTNIDRQSGTLAGAFTYSAPPAVVAVAPTSGPAAGGTRVSIDGTGFVSGATVTFGGAQGVAVAFESATRISATTPAHAGGAVTVAVRNPDGGQGALANGFTYVPAPTLSGIAPSSGPSAGGTSVSIAGTGFRAGATVSFGGVSAAGVNVSGPALITATTPAHGAGTVDVAVVNDDTQSATLPSAFSFVPPPGATAALPATGPAAGGTRVAISGTGFQAGATVTFGGAAGTDVSVDSDVLLHATAPAHGTGAVDVVVTNPDGQSVTLPAGFTYEAPPAAEEPGGCGCGTGGADLAFLAAIGAVLALRRPRARGPNRRAANGGVTAVQRFG